MPSPYPKPTEQKRLAGNPGKRPLPEPMAVIEGSVDRIPDAPESLGAAGTKRWLEVWSVADKWMVPTLDMSLLTRYCEEHDQRAYYQALLRKEGRMSRGSTGQPKLHPAVDKIERIDAAMLRMEHELGFSPSGRASLRVEKRDKPKERRLDRFTKTG